MDTARIRYYHALFYSGAVFNVLVAATFAFSFNWLYTLLGGEAVPDVPLLQLFTDLMGLAILLFAPVYFFAGWWLEKEESNLLITLGAVGKILFFAIVFGYAMAGLTAWGLVAVGVVDLLYAAFFIECLRYKSAHTNRQRSVMHAS
jgi:hypothetical protein